MMKVTLEKQGASVHAALLEDGKLAEYHVFDPAHETVLGRVIQGKITERVGGLNSFFVSLQLDRPGFLNSDNVKPGELVPVQVIQEPSGDKGYRVTTEISLSGRSIVVTPSESRISISSKISDPVQRARLKELSRSLPLPYGFILRTNAQDLSNEEIQKEAEQLAGACDTILARAKTSVSGSVLYQPPEPLIGFLNALPVRSLEKIAVEDKDLLKRLSAELSPDLSEKLEKFDQGRWSIRDFYHLTGPLLRATMRSVPLSDGGSIVIDRTEALTAIDVNSGSTHARDSERTILAANLKAAEEIARQIRLRNLSGIIVVDFIDMENPSSRSQLISFMKKVVKKDRQKVTIHGFTRLGLLEMTRQRAGLPLSSVMTDANAPGSRSFPSQPDCDRLPE